MMTATQTPSREYELTAFNLKLFAMITMFVDHVGAILLEKYVSLNPDASIFGLNSELSIKILNNFDALLRVIGRTAFPIFCFFIAQGAIYTSNRLKYLLRLVILALVAEIPFNFALSNCISYPRIQSTIFTLAMGLLAIYARDAAEKIGEQLEKYTLLRFLFLFLDGIFLCHLIVRNNYIYKYAISPLGLKLSKSYLVFDRNISFYTPLFFGLAAIIALLFTIIISILFPSRSKEKVLKEAMSWLLPLLLMFIADFFGMDYGSGGVLAILVIYISLQKNLPCEKVLMAGIICLTVFNIAEIFAVIDTELIKYYKGNKGKNCKYLFYIFYVGHLVLLGLIAHFFIYS